MRNFKELAQWQLNWGTPRGLYLESEGKKLEVAFLLALLFHLAPLSMIWHKHASKKPAELAILQNVELIEPEIEQPVAPPPVEVQKPKNALEFLKMAIPIFRKPETAPQIPKDVISLPKIQEPKIAEPERLIEKNLNRAPAAPEIKLDPNKNAPPPKTLEIAKLPKLQGAPEPQTPALKLEEVGRRAVALPPQTPAISLGSSRKTERAADLSAIPKTSLAPQSSQPTERLVERNAPASYKPPSLSAPLGYEKRGGGSVSLDQPREFVRPASSKPIIETPLQKSKEGAATLQISKERVKITGPLSSRKVVKSFVPQYPDWAKAKNIEADVAIRFTVSPEGVVVDTAIQRTSGHPALDKLSIEELKKWKFSSLASEKQDQWGVITFRFLLE